MIDLLTPMSSLTGDALKVYMVLDYRATVQNDIKIGLTLTELGRRTNLGTGACRSALDELVRCEYITMAEKGNRHVIEIVRKLQDDAQYRGIPFSFDNTDATKIAVLEERLLRLNEQYKHDLLGERSNLRDYTRGDERELIIEIESDLGRGLGSNEAYLMGKIIASFGPARAQNLWRQKAYAAKNPIPALYAMLQNGVRGKAAPQRQLPEFKDREVDVLE